MALNITAARILLPDVRISKQQASAWLSSEIGRFLFSVLLWIPPCLSATAAECALSCLWWWAVTQQQGGGTRRQQQLLSVPVAPTA